jgi:dephospho-CoA kinase
MKFKLGLTGSMGMGKTSTAVLFEKYNCGVWDADKAVHKLYGKGGDAVKPIAKHFPKATTDGLVNRMELKKYLSENFDQITLLENIVHPLVSADREKFIEKNKI